MKKNLKDAVILITGSSRGIGKATLERFIDCGSKVILHGHNPNEQLKKFCKNYSTDVVFPVLADLREEKKRAFLVETAVSHFGKLDVLVNNAGVIFREKELCPNSQLWQETFQVNLIAAADLIQKVIPTLSKSSIASIVNVSSIYGTIGTLDTLAYSLAKGSINTLTRTLAKSLAPKIRVNAVAPGNVKTDLTNSGGRQITDYFDSVTPLKRSATPEEIASAIVFLASPDASFITGQVLTVDGGYSIR